MTFSDKSRGSKSDAGFNKFFGDIASRTSQSAGRALTFVIAVVVVVVWAITGPIFQYSDTWQLVINTGTTIVTFLMVFLIQNSESRGSAAIQLKLDELLRTSTGARNALLHIEDLTLDDLEIVREHYKKLSTKARAREKRGLTDTGTPDVSV